jgi:hypothetical protein
MRTGSFALDPSSAEGEPFCISDRPKGGTATAVSASAIE